MVRASFRLSGPLPANGLAIIDNEGTIRLVDLRGRNIGRILDADLGAWFGPPQADLLVRDGATSYRLAPGVTEPRPEPAPNLGDTVYGCTVVDRWRARRLTICNNAPGTSSVEPVIKLAESGRTRTVAHAPFPPTNGLYGGHWVWAQLSPDGRTVLAQYSSECEVPNAFLVPAVGGPLRTLDGSPRAQPTESIALGWAPSGEAIVLFPAGACGDGIARPGIYRVAVARGRRTLIVACDNCQAVMWTAEVNA